MFVIAVALAEDPVAQPVQPVRPATYTFETDEPVVGKVHKPAIEFVAVRLELEATSAAKLEEAIDEKLEEALESKPF